MIHFAPCKINLGLHVLSRREDGYHNIDTCFYPVPWYDVVEIIPASHNRVNLSLSGLDIPGDVNNNLVVKAYHLLYREFKLAGIDAHVHKVLPTGAGLGGGSSDGAAALVLLNKIFNLNLSQPELHHFASQLGSDCAFFIDNKPKIGQERGDKFADVKVDLSGKYLVILKPAESVSTAEAYAGLEIIEHKESIKDIIENHDISEWRNKLNNDFEVTLFKKYPTIKLIKEKLYRLGAVYASMSGSGSAVFGIFDSPVLLSEFPEMISWAGKL